MLPTSRGIRAVPAFALAILLAGLGACGGNDSNGGLCESCGKEEACRPSVDVYGSDAERFCPNPPSPAPGATPVPCTVKLLCKNPVNSAARLCYPVYPPVNDLDQFYRCDGERPDPNS